MGTWLTRLTSSITDAHEWDKGGTAATFSNVIVNQKLFLPLHSTLVLLLVMVQQLPGSFLNNRYTSHEQSYRQQNSKQQQ